MLFTGVCGGSLFVPELSRWLRYPHTTVTCVWPHSCPRLLAC